MNLYIQPLNVEVAGDTRARRDEIRARIMELELTPEDTRARGREKDPRYRAVTENGKVHCYFDGKLVSREMYRWEIIFIAIPIFALSCFIQLSAERIRRWLR